MSGTIWSAAFWRGLGERAIKTAAQGFIYGTGLSVVVTEVGTGTGIALVDVPWLLGAQTALVMAAFSAVTSIGNADFTAGGDPGAAIGGGGYEGRHRLGPAAGRVDA